MPDIDHRTMTPPSLRITRHMPGPAGDQVFIWDLRLAQPNVSHIGMPVIHSFEHFLGTCLRDMADYVVLAAPMGCQTGFYIVTMGMSDFDTLKQLIISALEAILGADEVPLANVEQCGWAENHTLAGAQRLALWLFDRRDTWEQCQFADI
ncbi:MAG TPA: S-ribosylhomocysteine lyase [Streptosporangiaceae bacterium]